MKRTLLFIFLSLFVSSGKFFAQEYFPMPDSDASWLVTRCWGFYPGGWHDEYLIEMDGSDTMINGKVFKKLYLTTHHLPGTQHDSIYTNFLGVMREENRQVFFISEYLCLDTIERMVYDFNEVSAGDTIYSQILTNGLTQFIPHIVTSVDAVVVGGESRRRINLAEENGFNTESWIEGVGSSLGLTYASYWLLTDNSYDLNCFYDDDQLQFVNTSPTYNFCTAPLPDIGCDSLGTAVPDVVDQATFEIFPNPAVNLIHIQSATSLSFVRIINTWGKEVMACNYTGQLNLNGIPPGLYFIQMIAGNGQIMGTQKFVKT